MSDTPRTDKAKWNAFLDGDELGNPAEVVDASFARQLERELNGPRLSPPDRSEAVKLLSWLRANAPDCGDNSCLFGGRGKGGMRTNGGCRCFRDVRPDMKRIYVERLAEAVLQMDAWIREVTKK